MLRKIKSKLNLGNKAVPPRATRPPSSDSSVSENPRFDRSSGSESDRDSDYTDNSFRESVEVAERLPNPNDEAAKYRLRVQAQNNRFNELQQLGDLAVVGCLSLLVLPDQSGAVVNLERFTYWKATLKASPMYNRIRADRRGTLFRCTRERYHRMEMALCSLGQMLCLSCENLNDRNLIQSFSKLKTWAVENGMSKEQQDSVLLYLKWTSKVCLSIFLNSKVDEPPAWLPLTENGVLHPFDGPLRFISDFYFGRRNRSDGITLDEARALAQIASLGRALPYPSQEQTKQSVADTVKLMTSSKRASRQGLKNHGKGLDFLAARLKIPSKMRTHISLSNSSSVEATRSQGGRSAYLVSRAKEIALIPATREVIARLMRRVDCFGRIILDPVMTLLAIQASAGDGVRKPVLGDILYVPADSSAIAELSKTLRRPVEEAVPPRLGEILVNISCLDLVKQMIVRPSRKFSEDVGLLSFDKELKGRVIKMIPACRAIKLRASLSEEAGMKTRLVTSAPAAFTVIGQLVGNHLRSILSQDPFVRVGFEESDKLWEVLKAYRLRHVKTEVARRTQSSII